MMLHTAVGKNGAFVATPMFDDGMHGDGAENDGVFVGTTPVPADRRVRFWVEAKADSSIYEVRTHWQTFADFAAWTASPAFKEAHKDPPPREMFAGPHQLSIGEIFISSEAD